MNLYHFLTSADALGAYEFFAQCVSAPTIAAAKAVDPQQSQFCEIVSSFARRSEVLRVLDFAAGRGRFAAALARQLEATSTHLAYRAYNDPEHTPDDAASECIVNVGVLNSVVGVDAEVVDDLEQLSNSKESLFDICVMCNALHEIPPASWSTIFAQIGRFLKPDGCLVIMEDLELTVGEHPHDGGFLVLDRDELRTLFGGDDSIRIAASGYDGRLVAVEVPAKWLGRSEPLNLRDAFASTADRARRQFVTIRGDRQKSFQTGRALAFWAALHVNALVAADAQ